MKWLVYAVTLLVALAACSSQSTVDGPEPRTQTASCSTYESASDRRRLRVTCSAKSGNPEAVRDQLIEAAASAAHNRGFTWFKVYDRRDVQAGGERSLFGSSNDSRPNAGQPACDIFGCSNISRMDFDEPGVRFDRARDRSLFIEIQMGSGVRPAGLNFYDVRDTLPPK